MGFLNADGLRYAWQTYIAKALDKKVDKETGKGLSTNDYTTEEKNKLDGIAAGAEVNQNAFSNIKVGNTTITADSKTDTLNLVAGENVTITPTEGSDSIEIKAKDTVYTHPGYEARTSGLYKITVDNTGHISNVTPVVKSDITDLDIPGEDTVYTSGSGIEISDDKVISNTGVRSISSGDTNGTVKVNTNGTETEVAVKGLGSAAYTESSAYATTAQGTKADNAMPKSGGAFDGYITLKGDPTANLHPVTKQYFDSEILEINNKFDDYATKEDISNITIELDTTLTVADKAADAKAVGDKFKSVEDTISNIKNDLLTDDDVIEILSDVGCITPLYNNNNEIYTNNNNVILVL